MTEDIIRKHLSGDASDWQPRDYTIGVYPMLKDETCWFLAVDFDKENWQRDVSAFVATCHKKNVPVAVERSRSGNGAHAWIFFAQAIAAAIARKLGSALLTETMEQCPDIGFESYDRLFPNQDTMPAGGFGNLIALPFQKTPRAKANGVFVDERFVPYPDQWGLLQSIRRMAVDEVLALVDDASLRGRILGVRISHSLKDAFTIEKRRLMSKPPIFESIFGVPWADLPPVMQKHYAVRPDSNDRVMVSGRMNVKRNWLMKLMSPFLRVFGALVPYDGEGVPVTVARKVQTFTLIVPSNFRVRLFVFIHA